MIENIQIEGTEDLELIEPTPSGLISKETVAKIAGIVLQDPYEVSYLTRVRSIAASKTAAWIKSRKNAGLQNLTRMADADLAKELFEIWDVKGLGELTYGQVEEHFIALGLSGHPE